MQSYYGKQNVYGAKSYYRCFRVNWCEYFSLPMFHCVIFETLIFWLFAMLSKMCVICYNALHCSSTTLYSKYLLIKRVRILSQVRIFPWKHNDTIFVTICTIWKKLIAKTRGPDCMEQSVFAWLHEGIFKWGIACCSWHFVNVQRMIVGNWVPFMW